ncbi:GNAT family N-acetyltransferase [Nocardia sp. NPDC060249]|uniref:GNAT family N-acetyltransferase n=1 Tax=Nocardia sp. NPDC060249 TaxID=3347082 RepID=UPI003664DC44
MPEDGLADVKRFDPVPDPRPADAVWPELKWPISADAELVGETVRLNPVDPVADAAELFAVLDHDVVWAHIPFRPRDRQELDEFLRSWHATPENYLWIVRTCRAVAGYPIGAIVGMTSFLETRPRDARLEIGATLFAPEVWASGVNPEAKLLLLRYAFDTLGAGRVELKTDVRNHRSQQAIARLGARYEGTLRRYSRRADGTIRDSVLFSITVEDWPDVRARLAARLRDLERSVNSSWTARL